MGSVRITPALHRRHRSCRRGERDSNFGTIFAFWDRVLGTYVNNSSAVRVDTGLPELDQSPRLRDALVLPMRVYGLSTS